MTSVMDELKPPAMKKDNWGQQWTPDLGLEEVDALTSNHFGERRETNGTSVNRELPVCAMPGDSAL
jgi:hypothetical protein